MKIEEKVKAFYKAIRIPIYLSGNINYLIGLNNNLIYNSVTFQESILPEIKAIEENIYVGYFNYKNTNFILGPIFYKYSNKHKHYKFIEKNKLDESQIIYSDTLTFNDQLILLYTLITNKNIQLEPTNLKKEEFDLDLEYYRFIRSEDNLINKTNKLENELKEIVKNGEVDKIKEYKFSVISKDIGNMATNNTKQIEYLTVVNIALLTRAAIEGGLSVSKAYDTSDMFLQKVEKANSLKEYAKISEDSTITFTSLVKDSKKNKKDPYVLLALEYIDKNITTNITCISISKKIGITPDYFSKLFIKNMGIGVSKYIQQKKIKISCNILKYSDISINDISNYLSFASQSYFTKVFKETMKITPKVFRDNHRDVNFL